MAAGRGRGGMGMPPGMGPGGPPPAGPPAGGDNVDAADLGW